MVSLMDAPEPSSWAAMVCIPSRQDTGVGDTARPCRVFLRGRSRLPVQRAKPSTVWSRESFRLKSGMIWKLLVA